MEKRSAFQIACVMGAVLLITFHIGTPVRAQFAPVNKARDLEKSVLEGDDEVRKVKTGQAETKPVKPEAPKAAAAKPTVAKKATPKTAQTPPRVTTAKPTKANPTKTKPATAKTTAAKPVAVKPVAVKPAAKPHQVPAKTLVSVVKPARKKRRQRIRYVKPTAIIAIDVMDRQSLIPGISEDGRFVYIRVTPDTTFRQGTQTIPATAIVDGMKLDCWGGWEKNEPEIYTAKGAVVKGRLDDFMMRLKINEACQRLSRPRTEIASAPAQPTPVPEAPKPEEKKPEEKKPEEKKPEEPKPGEPKPGDPNPQEPKPTDPNAPPTNPESPKPEEPKPVGPATL